MFPATPKRSQQTGLTVLGSDVHPRHLRSSSRTPHTSPCSTAALTVAPVCRTAVARALSPGATPISTANPAVDHHAVDHRAAVDGPEDSPTDWQSIDWQVTEREVRRLGQRILTASQAGDLKRVRNPQKGMLRARSGTLKGGQRANPRPHRGFGGATSPGCASRSRPSAGWEWCPGRRRRTGLLRRSRCRYCTHASATTCRRNTARWASAPATGQSPERAGQLPAPPWPALPTGPIFTEAPSPVVTGRLLSPGQLRVTDFVSLGGVTTRPVILAPVPPDLFAG